MQNKVVERSEDIDAFEIASLRPTIAVAVSNVGKKPRAATSQIEATTLTTGERAVGIE
jgi:hypothetical protein